MLRVAQKEVAEFVHHETRDYIKPLGVWYRSALAQPKRGVGQKGEQPDHGGGLKSVITVVVSGVGANTATEGQGLISNTATLSRMVGS